MSDKGGSDLDVFKGVSKPPPPRRKKTLVGMKPPPGLAPPPPPSSGVKTQRGVPPPPPFAQSAEATQQEGLPSEEEPTQRSLPVPAPPGSESEDDAPTPLFPNTESAEADPNLPDFDDEDEATEVFSTAAFAAAEANRPGRTTKPGQPPPPASPPPPAGSRVDRGSAPPKPRTSPRPPAPRRSVPPPRSSAPPTDLRPPSRPAALRPSIPPAPPPPTKSKSPSKAEATRPSAAEWEEEDKTEIYSRDAGREAARKLLGTTTPRTSGVPDAPPPPMSRPSAPVPSPPKTTQRRAPIVSPQAAVQEPKSVPPAPTPSRTPLMLAAIVVVGLLVALFFYLKPTTGGLVVTVAGPGNKPLDEVQVLLNGQVACTRSPCRLEELKADTYYVQAKAPGYQDTTELAVQVTGGQDAVHNIPMLRASGTGIRVKAEGSGLKLYVDGREIGPLPQELKDLKPGKHQIKVTGEHFETWEKTVEVQADEMQTIGPLKLKVVKGLAMIKDGGNAEGARVVLQSGNDRRSLPRLPINLHIDTSKPHKLIATKEGFERFEQEMVFEEGQAERTFEIELKKKADEEKDQAKKKAAAHKPRRSTRPQRRNVARNTAKAAKGTLNFNSIPASKIILDGRPLGRTPKVGVSVSAGAHTVVFLHKGQRKAKRVSVGSGQTKTVIHRF